MAILSEHQISIGLNLALTEAEKAQQAETYPIGAVVTALDGEIIAEAHNRVKSHHDPTAHAEIEVIRSAGLYLSKNKWQGILVYYDRAVSNVCRGNLGRRYCGSGMGCKRFEKWRRAVRSEVL